MKSSRVSSTAGWDATPGRLGGPGVGGGQPLSLPRFRYLHLVFGVALPVVSIAAESLTGWSAAAYANPIPNRWFLMLALSAPASNLVSWVRLCTPSPPSWLVVHRAAINWANLLALAVSCGYGLLYLPIVPLALILSVFAVGLLPLAPFFAFYTAWQFRRGLRANVPASLVLFLGSVPALSTARRLLCQTTE